MLWGGDECVDQQARRCLLHDGDGDSDDGDDHEDGGDNCDDHHLLIVVI